MPSKPDHPQGASSPTGPTLGAPASAATPSPQDAVLKPRAWLRAQSHAAGRATRPLVALGLAQVAAGIAIAYATALLAAPILTHALQGSASFARTSVLGPALLFVAAAVLRAGLGLVADGRAFQAGAAARRRLRTAFLVATLRRGPHAALTGVEAVPVAIDRIDALEGYFARWLPAATLAWAGPALVLLAALPADPVAAAIMAAGGLFVPLGMALAGIGAAAASQQQFDALSRLQRRFLDRIEGIATIVMANQDEAEAARLRLAADELAGRTMRVLRVAFLSSAALDAAAAAVLVVLAIRAGLAFPAMTPDSPDPVAALFTIILVAEFFAPLRAFAASYQDRLQANAAAGALAAAPPPPKSVPAGPTRTIAASGVSIAFEDVRFAWDPARGDVLHGLSFRVPAGETAVLVGPSGAGKSTVIELLLGFVQPRSGRITVNGVPLDSLTPEALSRMTAWIGQRPALFAGTVRENIRFGREDASDTAIDDAVRAAGLEAVAAVLPQGLETRIGEGGYGLSGGQAQRVAIARAVLRQAPLLLLDEPTAHLDPATEADVLDSLRRLAIGRTVILAAHSSAAMAIAGRRILLQAGQASTTLGAA